MILHRILLTALIAIGAIACDDKAPEATPSAEAPAEAAVAPPAEAAVAPPAEAAPQVSQVEVPAEGKEFDPPVEVAQLPEGAYYCDMGTVHYARMEEGDNTCALCHMKLTKKQ